MTIGERNEKLKHLITCEKCKVSGKCCDENCPTQYDAGNMGEIIENLEAISEILEQEPCEDCISRYDAVRIVQHNNPPKSIEKLRNLPSVTPTRKKGK